MSLLEWLKFWSKFYRIPLFWNTVSEYPPQMKIVRDLGTLTFQFQNTPPPPQLKFRQILALWLFSFRIPPPLPKMKIVRDLGTLTFQFQNTPLPPPKLKFRQILALWLFSFRIPPPPNWNLGRSWHFKTFQFQNTPPPPNLNLVKSWHFKIFQFQNNWYQWHTMCGKLPHVETLSSPDNYSFIFWYTSWNSRLHMWTSV